MFKKVGYKIDLFIVLFIVFIGKVVLNIGGVILYNVFYFFVK